ncbi:hypothetical protein N7454_002593 [Penicillium verhagenii]|nr:hypothetical protein N7454_002593 [Penicillium verhagenii]
MHNPQPTPTSESSSHKGNCHCGAVRFSFTLSPPLREHPVVSCNCSICSRNGYLVVYPNNTDFTLESGKEVLKSYQCASRFALHRFCGDCGSSCFIQFPDEPTSPKFLVVNVRMLEDFDPDTLIIKKKTDGKTSGGEYKPQVNPV